MKKRTRVSLDHADGVAIVRMDDPDRRNCLSAALVAELIDTVEEVEADPEVGVLVLSSTGDYFCSGADTNVLASLRAGTVLEATQVLDGVYGAFTRIAEAKVPTVSAIRGGAVGAGLNLALSTDLRIVADDAVLRSGFARVGVHPGGGHFSLVEAAGGMQTSMAMGLFDAVLTGTEAVDAGLAFRSVPSGQVEAVALELSRPLAADPQMARILVRTARAEFAPARAARHAALELERWVQAWSFAGDRPRLS